MNVIGFNFTKITAERFPLEKEVKFERKISSNIDIDALEKITAPLIDSEVIKIDFKFTILYEPKLAELSFHGSMVLKGEDDQLKNLLKEWKKKKIISEGLQLPIYNSILKKCTLRALQLEEELGLPTHIKLPHLQTNS